MPRFPISPWRIEHDLGRHTHTTFYSTEGDQSTVWSTGLITGDGYVHAFLYRRHRGHLIAVITNGRDTRCFEWLTTWQRLGRWISRNLSSRARRRRLRSLP